MPELHGLPCVELKNATISLLATRTIGPRVLSLRVNGGPNLFAEVPDFTVGGAFRMLGGHRYWLAPEHPVRTYRPDDGAMDVEEIDGGVILTAPQDPATGLLRSLRLSLPGDGPHVVVDHALTNMGGQALDVAPWAITMLPPGGTAILPQPAAIPGVLPNRSWALWPYTDIRSPHVAWGDAFTLVHARVDAPLKLGWANRPGWLAYHRDGTLFVKRSEFEADAPYPDFNSSAEVYAHPRFLELETLAPLLPLAPGRSVSHRETWEVIAAPKFEATEAGAEALSARLRLWEGA